MTKYNHFIGQLKNVLGQIASEVYAEVLGHARGSGLCQSSKNRTSVLQTLFVKSYRYRYGYKKDGGFLFIRSNREQTRVNRYKLHWERFHLDIKKNFSTVTTIIHWNSSRDMVESPSLNAFKM